jgi:hypothetical protein
MSAGRDTGELIPLHTVAGLEEVEVALCPKLSPHGRAKQRQADDVMAAAEPLQCLRLAPYRPDLRWSEGAVKPKRAS